MNNRTADLLCLLLVGGVVVLAAVLWPRLPDPMPSHWNAAGDVDGYLPKFWGVAIMPLTALFIWGVMKAIPYISPKGYETGEFGGVLNNLQATMVAFMCFVAVLVLLAGAGYDVGMNRMMFTGMAVLFLIIGNYLGKVRKNFFLGIRTPWTLASDEVWARTHRLGGRLFMLGGAVMFVGGWLEWPPLWVIGFVVGCALWPVVYSYFLYRKVEGFGERGS